MIQDSARAGHIVVACGGGGIPIVRDENRDYEGVEAVIDKDLTSSVLAAEIGAELLIILTDVPQVYVHYGKPEQKALGAVTLEEIEALQREGHFAKGSMGPKVEAIVNFLKAGGKRGLITSPARLADAMDGRADAFRREDLTDWRPAPWAVRATANTTDTPPKRIAFRNRPATPSPPPAPALPRRTAAGTGTGQSSGGFR